MVSDHEHEALLRQLAEATERADAAESERNELRGRVGRVESEMESLKQRGRAALRCLGAIDPNASKEVIMYGVRDAVRAMNGFAAAPHVRDDLTADCPDCLPYGRCDTCGAYGGAA